MNHSSNNIKNVPSHPSEEIIQGLPNIGLTALNNAGVNVTGSVPIVSNLEEFSDCLKNVNLQNQLFQQNNLLNLQVANLQQQNALTNQAIAARYGQQAVASHPINSVANAHLNQAVAVSTAPPITSMVPSINNLQPVSSSNAVNINYLPTTSTGGYTINNLPVSSSGVTVNPNLSATTSGNLTAVTPENFSNFNKVFNNFTDVENLPPPNPTKIVGEDHLQVSDKPKFISSLQVNGNSTSLNNGALD